MRSKIAIVTGAAKGIGLATVRAFLDAGYAVGAFDIDPTGRDLAWDDPDRVLFQMCDVSIEQQVEAGVEAVVKRWGRIDVLVNNAGIQRYSTVTQTSEQEWDMVMNVNLKSAFLCAKHTIPHMMSGGQGVVINIASVQSFMSQKNVAPYTTSKTALLGLTRSIAVDYGPIVRCIAICPGTVDTPMLHEAIKESPNPDTVLHECDRMHVLERIAKPEEIAAMTLFLAGDKAPFITGRAIRIDGGLGITIPVTVAE